MLHHPVVASSGCCALCGFIVDNQYVIILSLVIMSVMWVTSLVYILVSCYRRNKRIKLLDNRRSRRADTRPAE